MVPWAVESSLCAYFSASACFAASIACCDPPISCSGGFWQPVSSSATAIIRTTVDSIPTLRIVFVLPLVAPPWGSWFSAPAFHGRIAHRLRKVFSLLFKRRADVRVEQSSCHKVLMAVLRSCRRKLLDFQTLARG